MERGGSWTVFNCFDNLSVEESRDVIENGEEKSKEEYGSCLLDAEPPTAAVRESDHHPPRGSVEHGGPDGGCLDDEHGAVKVEPGSEPGIVSVPVVGTAGISREYVVYKGRNGKGKKVEDEEEGVNNGEGSKKEGGDRTGRLIFEDDDEGEKICCHPHDTQQPTHNGSEKELTQPQA